ncbi:MAG TPA: fatty acid desaturase [Sphingomicrobium sp.]
MKRQSLIGISLAAAIMSAWAAVQIFGLFFLTLSGPGLLLAGMLVPFICWLNVGLFIIAHDAMHGSLASQFPSTNRLLGQLALSLYAAFPFERLRRHHMDHHRHPGTASDPDFDVSQPSRWWPWYGRFLKRYFGLKEFLRLCIPIGLLLLIGAKLQNILFLWALPAALSSFQLFYFGTFRPHRQEARAFIDHHRARSSDFAWLLSLMTCFHFGYHHEHHASPHVPWWRLPSERHRSKLAR